MTNERSAWTTDAFLAQWRECGNDYITTGKFIGSLGLDDRLLRLLAVACVRRVEHIVEDPECSACIDASERYAGGQATDEEKASARASARDSIGTLFVQSVGPGWEFNAAWRTSTAVSLATRIYNEKEWDACPILADALQDAGCESAPVLDYLRGGGQKFRGLWVLDHLTGMPN